MDQGENGSTSSAADLRQKVTDDLHDASEFAKREASAAADKAKDAADEQKNFLAGKLGSVAHALEKVAGELEQSDDREIGRMTKTLGSNLRNASDSVRDRSLSEIARMAEDFGRKQPLAFLSIAAVAGLAASRFLTSSSPGTDNSTAPPATSTGVTPSSSVPSTNVATTSVNPQEVRFNG